MKASRRSNGLTGMLARLLSAFTLLLVAFGVNADIDCPSLYMAAGAIPGDRWCQLNASAASVGMGSNVCTASTDLIEAYCSSPPDGNPEDSCPIADPVYPATGSTVVKEQDFISGGDVPFAFVRTYRAQSLARNDAGFGNLWGHNWQRKLGLAAANTSTPQVIAYREGGDRVTFANSGGAWRSTRGTGLALGQSGSGWTVTDLTSDDVESYSPQGVLLSVRTHNGRTITLTDSDANTPNSVAPAAGMLIAVTQHAEGYNAYSDLVIRLAYDSKRRITQMTDPTDAVTQYVYDSRSNLVSVIWPDGNVRRYVYDNPKFAAALTGVIDEMGSRIATWSYDAKGRVTAVDHPDTTRNVQLSYGAGTTTATDSTGWTTLTFSSIDDVLRLTGSRSAADATVITRDASANVIANTGNNATAEYTYDDMGRPIAAITRNSSGKSMTSIRYADGTTLHPSLVAAPGKMQAFVYDAQGNPVGVSEFTTGDPTGENGFDASTAEGSKTTWGATYDSNNNLSYLEVHQNGVLTAAWSITRGITGDFRSVTNRVTGVSSSVSSRDKANRIIRIWADEDSVNPIYDARGRLAQFLVYESSSARNGGVKRTLKVTYDYAPNGRLLSRSGTVATNGGADTPISDDDLGRWLNNYESGRVPIGPPANLLGLIKSQGTNSQADIGPVCVECFVYAQASLGWTPYSRQVYYAARSGQLEGGAVDAIDQKGLAVLNGWEQIGVRVMGATVGEQTCGDGCAGERASCRQLCSDSRYDPDRINVYYWRFMKCMKGCLPARCAGNPVG
ncbi:DUF6531 domain-containing protein [Paraburkholderia sp. SIMBA_030]|uniref:DUF6531 domain-containing protein n=1 Tax=Paraburkholderia sp. SIMBA_030 TaxID=3085773 RepID=UPI00397A92E3